METKEIEVDGKKYQIKKLTYLEGVEIEEVKQKEGMAASIRKMFEFSGITSEQQNTMDVKHGLEVQKAINQVNDLENFQQPPVEEEKQK